MKKKNKLYPDVTQTTSTRYLKKTGSNEWFDRRSGQLFYKQKGRLMIKIDEQERKAHRQLMAKLRNCILLILRDDQSCSKETE